MVDIDGEVVEACSKHLGEMHQGAFDDPRLEVVTFERAKQLIKGARPRTEKRYNSPLPLVSSGWLPAYTETTLKPQLVLLGGRAVSFYLVAALSGLYLATHLKKRADKVVHSLESVLCES